MATYKLCETCSKTEVVTYFCDFTDKLAGGVTVVSAVATHTPPSGAAVTPTVATITSPYVNVTVPALGVEGIHRVSVLATLSDGGEKSEILLIIPVKW